MERDFMLDRIKELRERHGISQKELAEMLRISPPSVSNWEHGKTKPTKANLQILAQLFGVSVDYLMGMDRPITMRIMGPSDRELRAILEKYKGLPDKEFDMLTSLMNYFIAVHDGGRVNYGELSLLDGYANYLQYVLSSEAEKKLAGEGEVAE